MIIDAKAIAKRLCQKLEDLNWANMADLDEHQKLIELAINEAFRAGKMSSECVEPAIVPLPEPMETP